MGIKRADGHAAVGATSGRLRWPAGIQFLVGTGAQIGLPFEIKPAPAGWRVGSVRPLPSDYDVTPGWDSPEPVGYRVTRL